MSELSKLVSMSVIPMVMEDETVITVSRMAGGGRTRRGFPEDLHVSIQRPNGESEERRYILASEEENRARDAAMAWSKVESSAAFANVEAVKAKQTLNALISAANAAHEALALACTAALTTQKDAAKAMYILGIPAPEIIDPNGHQK